MLKVTYLVPLREKTLLEYTNEVTYSFYTPHKEHRGTISFTVCCINVKLSSSFTYYDLVTEFIPFS